MVNAKHVLKKNGSALAMEDDPSTSIYLLETSHGKPKQHDWCSRTVWNTSSTTGIALNSANLINPSAKFALAHNNEPTIEFKRTIFTVGRPQSHAEPVPAWGNWGGWRRGAEHWLGTKQQVEHMEVCQWLGVPWNYQFSLGFPFNLSTIHFGGISHLK